MSVPTLKNRVKQQIKAYGVGPLMRLGGGVSKFRTFDQAAVADQAQFIYLMESNVLPQWEIGRGKYIAPTDDDDFAYVERLTAKDGSSGKLTFVDFGWPKYRRCEVGEDTPGQDCLGECYLPARPWPDYLDISWWGDLFDFAEPLVGPSVRYPLTCGCGCL